MCAHMFMCMPQTQVYAHIYEPFISYLSIIYQVIERVDRDNLISIVSDDDLSVCCPAVLNFTGFLRLSGFPKYELSLSCEIFWNIYFGVVHVRVVRVNIITMHARRRIGISYSCRFSMWRRLSFCRFWRHASGVAQLSMATAGGVLQGGEQPSL